MKTIEKLQKRLSVLEFELRYESDPREMDVIANERDAVARELESLVRDGLDPDCEETICDVCGIPIPEGEEIMIDSHAPENEPQEVPAHEHCRHHTCRGMSAKRF